MIQNDGSSSPTLKRKRTFSNQNNQNTTPVTNNSSENHFLYQKVMELTKELEEQKAKIASSQMSTPSQQAGPQLLSRPNMQDQFCRQSTPVQYPGQAVHLTRQSDPSMFPRQDLAGVYPTGPPQPVPMTSWSIVQPGSAVPHWGHQNQ